MSSKLIICGTNCACVAAVIQGSPVCNVSQSHAMGSIRLSSASSICKCTSNTERGATHRMRGCGGKIGCNALRTVRKPDQHTRFIFGFAIYLVWQNRENPLQAPANITGQ